MDIRTIAIHLPQFHPIPENDAWWGKGFTEWTNVTKATPLYSGHYQPHLPADLGFYDLRLPEARQAQADLAREYGIHGFCYYHYWFNGRRVLERPVEEILSSGQPDFPFMVCWANENWTRVWDGGEKHVLLEQVYAPEDDINHIRSLIPLFKDPRYIRIHNKPVFAIYKSDLLPDMRATILRWRAEALSHGIELYLCRMERTKENARQQMEAGFDAAIEFQPQVNIGNTLLNPPLHKDQPAGRWNRLLSRAAKKLNPTPEHTTPIAPDNREGVIVNYEAYIHQALREYNAYNDYPLFRGVCPGWDNSSRRKNGYAILDGSTPELFEFWAKEAIAAFNAYSPEENLFFVNAWNEWAEGNHLEPCRKWGRAYLQALRKAMTASSRQRSSDAFSPSRIL